MEDFLEGRIYCLDSVLTTQDGSRYLMFDRCAEDKDYTISFGPRRKINVSMNSYIVHISNDGLYDIEKIPFNEKRECNYLNELKKRNINYSIPKRLEETIDYYCTRFEQAIGLAHWDKQYHGYFAANGYAIVSVGHISFDRFTSYYFCLNKNPGALCFGKEKILEMSGYSEPKVEFIKKILTQKIQINEDEALIEFFREGNLDIENTLIASE